MNRHFLYHHVGFFAGIYNLISCPIIFGCLTGICHMTHLQYSQSVSTVQTAQLVNHLSCKQKIVGSSHAQGKHFFQLYNIYVYIILLLISFSEYVTDVMNIFLAPFSVCLADIYITLFMYHYQGVSKIFKPYIFSHFLGESQASVALFLTYNLISYSISWDLLLSHRYFLIVMCTLIYYPIFCESHKFENKLPLSVSNYSYTLCVLS